MKIPKTILHNVVETSCQWCTQRRQSFSNACESREAFKKYIRTKDSETNGGWSWINQDLLPTPKEKRTWASWNYVFFYSSLAMDSWTLGSGLIGIGLNWWQSIIVCFVSQAIGALASALNARSGGVYHIGFPVVARSVFGMYGAYYAVAARAVLAAIYFSIKVYSGSSFVGNMLQAVFGKHYTSIPNHVPKSIGFTSKQFLAFFLYWLVHVPFVWLRPNQLRWLFTLKMIIIVPTMTGLFIFCMVNTKADLGLSHFKSSSKTSLGWLFMYGLNSGLGTHSTLVTNQPDFSRWSRKKGDSIWTLFVYPFSATIAATFGILSTSAINKSWGLKLWNQWDLLAAILDRYPNSGARFAVFLCALCWAILTLGTNVAANLIPFGSDAAMLLPRYFDMRRGQILVLFLAWPIFPWKILASAATFNTFLSGYGLFMGGLSGVMVIEYMVWSKGNIFTQFLYHPGRSNTHYNYFYGWNLAAFAAYIAGCIIPLPGFAGKLGGHVSKTAGELYYIGWLMSFCVSMIVYSVLCLFIPTQNQKKIRELGFSWEENAPPPADFDFSDYKTSDGTIIGLEAPDPTAAHIDETTFTKE